MKKDMKEAVGDVLREMGTFLKAERTYMLICVRDFCTMTMNGVPKTRVPA